MKIIRSADEVVETLGGTCRVAEIFGIGSTAVSNWRALDYLPARTIITIQKELASKGCSAAVELFPMHVVRNGKTRRPKRANPEHQIQCALVQHLHRRAWPDVVWYAIPNGGHRSPTQGAILKREGVLAGVPDLAFVHRERAYFLELKAPGGRPTESQLAVKSRLDAAGAYTAIAYGLDRALACLEAWGLIR